MAKVTNNSTIDYVIGLPPSNPTDETIQGRTQIVIENSMPIAKIYPGVPSFTKGLSLFSRAPAFRSDSPKALSYLNLLNSHGYGLKQPKYADNSGNEGCLVVAYQADSFPTDSFTNDYGENFLQGMTSVASEAAASLAQMRGARSATEVLKQLTGAMKEQGGLIGGAGSGLEGIGAGARKALEVMLPKAAVGGIDIVDRLMAGSRIDFPMVWKSSTFQPSYTMTVRLYNPVPGSKESTRKYIAAPIAALMLLAIPVSSDGVTYSWPFIHRIVSPGIYNLDPAFISNITIIKGGDQQQISYKQSLGVVDVRIDFGSLFSSMLAAHNVSKTRPTLTSYLDAMVGPTDFEKPGVERFSTFPSQGQTFNELLDQTRLRRNQELLQTKNQAQTTDELTDQQKDNPPNRVSTAVRNAYNNLVNSLPSF